MDELSCFFRLLYEQQDISTAISDHLISINYIDHLTGKADELSIELENIDGRWCEEWYPGHGDILTLELGWDQQSCRKIGSFAIDEIEFRFSPSTVSIRAIAATINRAIRTKEAHSYEGLTLNKVVEQVAARQNLELVGAIETIALDRVTQQQSDIEFLNQLADDYDYAFKLNDDKLIFYAISELEQLPPVCALQLTDISSGYIRDQIKEVPQNAEVKSYNPASNKLVIIDVKNETTVPAESSKSAVTTSSDTVKNSSRASSIEVATAKAKADLQKANRQRTSGSVSLKGKPHFLSGNVIELKTDNLLAGNYLITSSSHSISRSSGYTSQLELNRIKSPLMIKVKQTGKASSGKGLVTYSVKRYDEGKKQ